MAPKIELEADHLRDKARKDLLGLLEGVSKAAVVGLLIGHLAYIAFKVRGKKNLVIGKDLTGPVGLIVKFSILQEYGVDKVFVLENSNTDSSQRNIVYLVHGEKAVNVQAVAEQIRTIQKNGTVEHEISILWVPRRTLVSNKILEDTGVLGDVNVLEFPLYFMPLEKDLLSLELDDAFVDMYLRHDPTAILLASKALMQIQQRHGLFPRILGKGDNARRLANLLLRGRKELDVVEPTTIYSTMPSTSIENLIIIDRDVDFASLLLTQLTYEGLIDELIGIKYNKAEIDSSVVGGTAPNKPQQSASSASHTPALAAKQSLKRTVQLDSTDSLYASLRLANFVRIGPLLNRTARRLEAEYEKRHAPGVKELKEFVNKFPAYQLEHQSLTLHTNLADEMSKYTRSETFNRQLEVEQNLAAGSDPTYQHDTIEELISRDIPLPAILRMLCLESTVSGGIRPRDLENFKRQILHAYGHQHLLTLDKLEKMELLQPRSSASALLLPVGGGAQPAAGTKTNYAYMRREFKLINDEYNETDPEDISYVYSGYAPLSVRIVQCILQKYFLQSLRPKSPLPITPSSTGWQGFEDILKSVKGPTFNIAQKASDEKAAKAKASLVGEKGWKTIFVFFLGGITAAEVAALRFVNSSLEAGGLKKRIVICTTGMISGRSVMEDVIEKSNLRKKTIQEVGG